jgi:large subunit ribosomal protein L6
VRAIEVSRIIQIPEDVDLTLEGREVTAKGPKGSLTKDFHHAHVSMEVKGKTMRIWSEWPRKQEASLVGTVNSHVQNMIIGVTKGFTYKLKIVFSHFPISVKVKDKSVLIENFTGERNPRKAKIAGDAKVKVQTDDILVQNLDLDSVSQTAANIEQATKVKRKDPRVFLDGIYVYERAEGMEE